MIFLFTTVDFITGIWKSKKKGIKITSFKMRNTVPKLIGYLLIIFLTFLIEKFIITTDAFHLINVVCGYLVVFEFKSITENLEEITEQPIFTKIFEYVNGIFTKKVNK